MALSPRIRYPGQISTADPAGYPEGAAQDVMVSGDGTGTPWQKDLVNDLFGFQQALLAEAGISPSKTPDKVGASQYLDAIKKLNRGEVYGAAIANGAEVTTDVSVGGLLRRVLPGRPTGVRAFAIGTGGAIVTTERGLVWTQRTPAGSFSGSFNAGAVNDVGAQAVIAGSGGAIQTSGNLETWTERTADESYAGDFLDAAFGAGKFVLVGTGDEIQTSSDLVTWVARPSPFSPGGSIAAVIWAGDRFIAFCDHGASLETATSVDGETWTLASSIATAGSIGPVAVAYADGVVVVVSDERVARSADLGATWTVTTVTGLSTTARSIAAENGIFAVALPLAGGGGSEVLVSIDAGKTWRTTGVVEAGSGGVFVLGRFYAAAGTGGKVFESDRMLQGSAL